ncbi:hypothetical protein ACHQM5_014820 [Ranunculus cassubicifolius]
MRGVEELKNFVKVWITVTACLTYCYFIVRKTPKGSKRLILLIPVFSIFTLLPLYLSSIHFIIIVTGFITWICNFKLILFAFNSGPLSSNPSISLPQFISIASLPVQIRQKNQSHSRNGPKTTSNYALKALLLALLLKFYDFRQFLHPKIILVLYACHIYFIIEIILAISAFPVRTLLGFEIEPQFDDPYLTASLEDLWGKRWNLMISNILRITIHIPIKKVLTRVVGRKGAAVIGLLASFIVSGFMHELLGFYLTRSKPSWELACFFTVNGIAVALEILVKNAVGGRFRFPFVISFLLTWGYITTTGFWFFFPPFVRNRVDWRAIEEYYVLADLMKGVFLWPLRNK